MNTNLVIEIKTGLTIQEMLTNGKYDWVDRIVNVLPCEDPSLVGKWECNLVKPKIRITSYLADKLCHQNGWQSAKIDHLLVFGATYPRLQLYGCIAALATQVRDGQVNRDILMLGADNNERIVSYQGWSQTWSPSTAFLSVRRLG